MCWVQFDKQSFSYFCNVYVFGLNLREILKLDGCTKLCPLLTECLVTCDHSCLPPCSTVLHANLPAVLPVCFVT